MLLLLLPCLIARAQADPGAPLADQPFTARPFGYLIGSFSPVPAVAAANDGFELDAHLGAEARLNLGTAGQMGALVEARLSPTPSLKDGLAFYRPAPFLRLDLGQFKVPYSVGFLASETRRLLPAPPLADAGMVGRDVGFMVTASLPIKGASRASAQLAAFNGEGPNELGNADLHYLYAVRAMITPLGARSRPYEGSDGSLYLGLGGGMLYNRIHPASGSERLFQYGADLQFAWNVLSLQGEFLYGQHTALGLASTDYDQVGGYGMISLFIPLPWVKDHLQLVGRYGRSDPNDSVSGAASEDEFVATQEITGGLNLYWFAAPGPFNDVKLQAAYSHFDELAGRAFRNDRLLAAASIRF